MSSERGSIVSFELREGDQTAEELSLMLEKIDQEMDDKVHFPTSLNLFLRMHGLRQKLPNVSIVLRPKAEETLEDGVFEYARITSSRHIIDRVNQMYKGKLLQDKFDITHGEYEDKLKEEVIKVFGENCDTKWLDKCKDGRKTAILQTLYEFSGKKPLGIYSQDEVGRMTSGIVEEFGTSYPLPTKFSEIKAEYYYPEGESTIPVISFVVNPS